eukprot:SM000044S16039  [mRNA]  locus=s44:603201:604650:- [translate_table: standard]
MDDSGAVTDSNNEKLCEACEVVAAELEVLLADPQTTEELIVVLEATVCTQAQGKFLEQCKSLVEMYVPQMIQSLQVSLNADTMCVQTGICQSEQINAIALHKTKKEECVMCHFFILEAKRKLKDPVVQPKVLVFLANTCNRVPEYADQCKDAVGEYAPIVFANIDVVLDAKVICSKIGACPAGATPKLIKLPVYSAQA